MEVSGKTNDSCTKGNTGKSSDGDGKIFCQPCASDGDTVVAIGYCQNCNEYMCSGCLKVHRKQALSRNHAILDGDKMPKMATLPSVTLNACSNICPKHENEIIKYYCSSHDAVGCGDCMVIGHKSCKVDRIQDISTAYFNGTEHEDMMKKVEQFVKSMDEMKKDIKTNEINLQQACEKAVKDVQIFKKEIIDYLDKAEREMLELISKKEEGEKGRILKMKKEEKRLNDDIQEIQEKLQLQLNQANKLFVEAKQVKEKLCSIDENIEQLKKDINIDLYEFCRSSRIGKIIDSGDNLGELSKLKADTKRKDEHGTANEERVTKSADQAVLKGKNISEMEAYFDCEINIKLQDDTSDCYVSDSALLSTNQLIIADYDNSCIKIVDVRNKQVSKYKLSFKPTGVAVVNPNLIAVSLQFKTKIQFLTITTDNKITEGDMINVDIVCENIAIYEDQIFGITYDSVEIMSMRGQKIKSISHPKMTRLIDIAVVPSSKTFYVSNISDNNKGVYKFDFDGNLIATYEDKDLVHVRGLDVTRGGTLLVCNWTRDGSIHMITPDCKKIKELLKQNKHVNYPCCVAFCEETNKLFIANNNVLKVFQLK